MLCTVQNKSTHTIKHIGLIQY